MGQDVTEEVVRTRWQRLSIDAREFWRRFRKSRAGTIGLAITLIMVFMAVGADYVSPMDPYKYVPGRRLLSPSLLEPPSMIGLFGTDQLGRDVLSRTIYGTQISLFIGALAASTSTVIGTMVGGISGYLGGKMDELLMRITEYFMVIPRFFLALLLVAIFGASVWNIIFAIGILSWPQIARLVRSEYLSLKEQEFVEAAKADGSSNVRIAFFEILPNASPPIIIMASLLVAASIIVEAGLAFLGMGDPSVISWGTMLQEGQVYIRDGWWMMFFPGLAISLTVLSLNLVGDGVNDALNPRLKER
jgi:peptide/nickel transport system permease protein